MSLYKIKKKYLNFLKIMVCIIIVLIIQQFALGKATTSNNYSEDEITEAIEHIFENRNKAMLIRDLELIESIYDTNTKYGTWAYEHEKKKMQYIHNWEQKQGVKFIDIIPKVVVRKISNNNERISANLLCSTEYKYIYEDKPEVVNSSRIGTYHVLQLINRDGIWLVTKEWYKDPFADSLSLDNLKFDAIKQHILSQEGRDVLNINKRRIDSMEYAEKFLWSGYGRKIWI